MDTRSAVTARIIAIIKAQQVRVTNNTDSLEIKQGGRKINVPLLQNSSNLESNSYR